MTKRRAFSPCLGLNVNVVRFCARGKKRGRGDGGARRGISELGYLNWGGGHSVGRGMRFVNVALPYSRDRGVNSAYLSVRHGVLAFS